MNQYNMTNLKFPMHLKNDASFPSGNRHDGTKATARQKKNYGLCLFVTDNCS